MRSWILPALALVLLSPGLAGAKDKDWLAEVEKAYQRLASFRTGFTQKTVQLAFGQEATAAGRILYAKGRLRMEFAWPDPATYIVNPEVVMWIQPENRQVVPIPAQQLFQSGAPMVLLGGMAHLGEFFRLRLAEHEGAGLVRMDLEPTFPDPHVAALKIWFDPARGHLVRMATTDVYDNENTLEFNAFEVNPKIADELLEARVPPGYKVFQPNF